MTCKRIGHSGRQCQHVCEGVCSVCGPVRNPVVTTQATVVDDKHRFGLGGFAAFMNNVSKLKVVGDGVGVYSLAALAKEGK